MEGVVVLAVQVLIDAGLFHHEDFGAGAEDFVELAGGKFIEKFCFEVYGRLRFCFIISRVWDIWKDKGQNGLTVGDIFTIL